jgi:hypothetical protein
MRGWIFTLATALSAVLFVAVCVLWARSEMVRDYAWVFLPWPADATVGGRRLKVDFDSGAGQVSVAWKVWPVAERERMRQFNPLAGEDVYHETFKDLPKHYARLDAPTMWNRIGFMWFSGSTHSSIHAPYWALALFTAGLPGFWMATRRRRRLRKMAGRCMACGYDLRATPERCPECGAVPANRQTAA